MIPILTPNQLNNIPQSFIDLFQDLETFIIQDAARRIKTAATMTSTAEWQIERAKLYNIKNVEAKIAETLKLSRSQIDILFPQIAEASLDQENKIYSNAGLKTANINSKAMQDYIKAAIKNTKGDIENITQSLGFAETQNGHVVYNSVAKFYQKELNLANIKVVSGTQDYNSAIRQATKKIGSSGLRYINYESGYSNNIDVAIRRAIITSIHQMTQQMTDFNMEKLIPNEDDRYVEITSHENCRPSHLSFQGRVFKVVGSTPEYPNLVEATGLGKVEGLKGANCKHDYYPFIPGVSVRSYTDKQLKEMEKKSKETFSYKGKKYTGYEATQYQRKIESSIRNFKREQLAYKEAGMKDDYNIAKSKINQLRKEYKDFSSAAGISEKKYRLSI